MSDNEMIFSTRTALIKPGCEVKLTECTREIWLAIGECNVSENWDRFDEERAKDLWVHVRAHDASVHKGLTLR